MANYIFNICCLIASFTSFFAVTRFWQTYKRTGLLQFKNLSFSFFFIGLAYLILSLPKLVLFNPFWVQIDFILVDLSFLSTGFFAMPVILSFFKKPPKLEKNASRFLLFILLTYIILNIFFFTSAIPLFSDGILVYFKNGVFWLHSILWLPLTSMAGIFGGQFLTEAIKAGEKKLFWKGLMIGKGCILVFIAGILFWYFKFLNPSSEILNLSGIIGVLGFTLGAVGATLFPPPREILIKKIT
jgi:hypothetical protein